MRRLTRIWVASGNKTSRSGRRYSAAHQAPTAKFAPDDEEKTDLSAMMKNMESLLARTG
jgi:hypothetical protein